MVPGGVDLGDQPVDHHVGIGHQRNGVAAHDWQTAATLGQLGQHVVLVGFVGNDTVRFNAGMLEGVQQRAKLLAEIQLPPAQPVLADQQVEPQSDPGLEEDDGQPCQAGGRFLLS